MADQVESTGDHEMISAQEPVDIEEKPSTDIEELKQAVTEDSNNSFAADESAKANVDQEEEEEYVLKDEAHGEEDNQKDGNSNDQFLSLLHEFFREHFLRYSTCYVSPSPRKCGQSKII